MSPVDDSQSSGRSSHSAGYVPDNEQEKEEIEDDIKKEVNEEVEQHGLGCAHRRMSSVDDSQSSGRSYNSSGYVPDNEEEKEEIKEEIREEDNEEVEPGPGVLSSYIYPDLSLEASEIEKRQKDGLKKLFKDKKLILVLDLDYTLIDSILLDSLTDSELYLLGLVDMPDYLFQLDGYRILIKLRPWIHDFLKEANNMFEMYLCSMRQHDFAKEIAALLDPHNVYFPFPIISGPNNTTRIKNVLDAELGVENVVIILDDTETVWEDHKKNLIVLEVYNFFDIITQELGPGIKSLSEVGIDESKTREALESILHVLQLVHECFYDPELEVDLASRDVQVILASFREAILEDCNIVFSGVFPSNVRPEEERIWKLAEGMGATCSTEVNDSATHVVAADPNIINAKWAKENNKFLVTTHWIMAAHYLWNRPKEEKFPVKH